MAPTNRALLLPSAKVPTLVLSEAPYTPPSAGELVIKTHAVALNPADYAIQRKAILVSEDGYPCILGCDVAGEVVELPPSSADDQDEKYAWLKHFKIGDRVIGQTGPTHPKPPGTVDLNQQSAVVQEQWTGKKLYPGSAFQDYVILRGPLLVKIPDTMSYEDAVVLPLGMATASSCLFPPTLLHLDFPPWDRQPAQKDKILLVWGASSSVGSCGVQLATQAGYSVIGICSLRNHAMVQSLGAVQCFDQASPTIVKDVANYIRAAHPSNEVVGAYDGIATEETQPILCEILHVLSETGEIKTRKFIGSVFGRHAAHGVEVVVNMSQGIEQFYATAAKIRPWLEAALEDGRIKCSPEKEVLGKGFDVIQAGMDRLAEGKVSGRKLVVSL
jgi:NADPH:quinone reductase-like Zn-dependent oxidoreductase